MHSYTITMKNILLAVIASFLTMNAVAQQTNERYWKGNVEKVRIISYNILNGFEGGADKDRQARLVEWVRAQDPEVMALQELCGFTQASLEALGKQWGHPYAAIVKENGYPMGITSKKPIEVVNKFVKGYCHGMLHVRTYGFDFLVTHLNPQTTVRRRQEAARIIEYVKEQQLTDFMLMGDMNAHSPFDAEYLEHHATRLPLKYGGESSPNLMEGNYDYSTISTFLSYPLIDVCRKYVAPENRTSFPTPILYDVSKNRSARQKVEERLDYIFATPAIAKMAVDAFVWKDGVTEYLSDHYPVGIDLVVENIK